MREFQGAGYLGGDRLTIIWNDDTMASYQIGTKDFSSVIRDLCYSTAEHLDGLDSRSSPSADQEDDPLFCDAQVWKAVAATLGENGRLQIGGYLTRVWQELEQATRNQGRNVDPGFLAAVRNLKAQGQTAEQYIKCWIKGDPSCQSGPAIADRNFAALMRGKGIEEKEETCRIIALRLHALNEVAMGAASLGLEAVFVQTKGRAVEHSNLMREISGR